MGREGDAGLLPLKDEWKNGGRGREDAYHSLIMSIRIE